MSSAMGPSSDCGTPGGRDDAVCGQGCGFQVVLNFGFSKSAHCPIKGMAVLQPPQTAFAGQAVFLQAAVGFVGDGHFDQVVFQGWFEVACSEGFTV